MRTPSTKVTSVLLPDDLRRRINLAAASAGVSTSEYIRAAATAAMATQAEHDRVLAATFAVLDQDARELVSA